MTYALKPASDAPNRPDPVVGLSSSAAMEELRRRLVRFAFRMLWNRDDAEEVTQDACLIALQRGITLSDANFGPWMFRTVANLSLNRRRSRKADPLDESMYAASGSNPATLASDAERLERLRKAVESLPDQQRLAVVLKTQEMMDYADIARVMEITESAVRGHVYQARRKLAELLSD